MAASVTSWLCEKRPLKKQKLGPPDVYPQESRQKEDELTSLNVKQGFVITPSIHDEYGTCRNNNNISASKFGPYFSALLSKKQELNTLLDTTRKKPQINAKDNMWLVTARSKNAVDAWFKDLSSGSKTLSQLSRKVPIFNKKEEIFTQLCDFGIPMLKAGWFIKMSCAYQIALAEANNKSKKRQMPDPSQEWTSALCRFMREQYQKLAEHYHTQAGSVIITSEETVQKNWQYYTQLARHLFDEGLLDRHEFLSWLLDLLEKIKSPDDPVIRIVVPLILEHADDFTQSELISRKLAYHCCKKLSQLVNDYDYSSSTEQNKSAEITNQQQSDGENVSKSVVATSNQSVDPLVACFSELINCSQHRNVVLGLSAIVQIITLECPAALVWHNIGDVKSSYLQSSPLDQLPCAPSSLPMPQKPENQYLRNELRKVEDEIRQRSRASEMHWSCDHWEQSSGTTVAKLLRVLEALDRHYFDKVDMNNSLDTLFNKIFSKLSSINEGNSIDINNTKMIMKTIAEDEPVVKLLCEWAVTTKRTGEHRALVVAKLLEKRQNDLTCEKEIDNVEETESEATDVASNNSMTNNHNQSTTNEKLTDSTSPSSSSLISFPIYQNLLLNFLDTQAPVYEERMGINNSENKQAFSNLIILFAELIRCDVFSHDSYMCTLISRGQFFNSPITSSLPNPNPNAKSNATEETSLAGFVPTPSDLQSSHLDPNSSQKSSIGSSLPMFDPVSNHSTSGHQDQIKWDVPSMDVDEAHIDADLDKILQNIKAGQQNMNDHADILLHDSVGSDKEDEHGNMLGSQSSAFNGSDSSSMSSTARHLLYTMHFPLPQDETSSHDCNQRHILLYGVGKARDEARHCVKKITKDISKLFNRKSSMDINDSGKVKKNAIKEGFNFDTAISRFQSLSTFDQHVVINSCSTSAMEMINGVACGASSYLPLIESIAFLFDLMEMALYVHGLIEFVIQMLKELIEVDNQLHQKCPILAKTYCTSIGLYIVGVLYRYQSCLLVSHEDTVAVFEGLWKLIKHVSSTPNDCTSAERCILYYLNDLYTSCAHLKSKYHETVASVFAKIKVMNNLQMQMLSSSIKWDNNPIMMEYLKNPKLKVDPIHIRQLNENSSNLYCFVCNAIINVADCNDVDSLNEMSVLCSELTSSCPALSDQWLCVLKALCCSSNHTLGYYELLARLEVSDLSIHDNLAVFTSILIARRCFSLKDFIIQVALPSLLALSDPEVSDDAEYGARLTCHLLLCLFKTSEALLSSTTMATFAASSRYSFTSPGPSILATTPPTPGKSSMFVIKYPCDRYLLAGAHNYLRVEVVLTVLKAILVLGNATEKNKGDVKPKVEGKDEISIMEILGPIVSDDDFDYAIPFPNKNMRLDFLPSKAGLSESAKFALRQICGQQWVHDRCLRGFMNDTDMLSKLLLDPKLSSKDSQYLLSMICHPKLIGTNLMQEMELEQKQTIAKILQKLDEWTMRVSWLQLQLMYAQCSASGEITGWLENVAKSTVDFFQNASNEKLKTSSSSSMFSPAKGSGKGSAAKYQVNHANQTQESIQKDKVWLIAPLISKLPTPVQGKILKVAANVLEGCNWITIGNVTPQGSYSSSKNKDRSFQQKNMSSGSSANSTSSLLSHQPFLCLVLMCLKGQDDQRESLLSSLYSQLSQTLSEKVSDDVKAGQSVQDGLVLRLSLVGGMFDMIQRSNSLINDWAMLLLQLITFNVVDPQINYELYTTVLDMLAVLIHTTQASESSDPREENKKQYQNLIKKLKKELTSDKKDLISPGIKIVRQLLPIVKLNCEVITCEPMGSLIDTKGNKIAGFDSIDKKQGLQVAEKEKVSPWDLMEGHKNPSPLSWTWFGAVRIERKPIRGEDNHHLLARHDHSKCKPAINPTEPPPLPPEDVIEPPAAPPTQLPIGLNNERINIMPTQTQMPNGGVVSMPTMSLEDQIRQTIPMDASPRAPTPKKPKATRRRRATKNAAANSGQITPPTRMPTAYDSVYGAPPNQQQQPAPPAWYTGQQQVQMNAPMLQQPQTQQNFYQPQQPQQITRYNDNRVSKTALKSMLVTRTGAANQFGQVGMQQTPNVPPNIAPPVQNTMNTMNTMGQVVPTQGYPNRQQFQQGQLQQRQMRAQLPPQQTQLAQMNVSQPSNMYQMQQQQQPNQASHHLQMQSQPNYGGQHAPTHQQPPPNMSYGNAMHMQGMDQSVNMNMSGPPGPPSGYHNPPPQQQQQQQQQHQMMQQMRQPQMQQPQMQQQQQVQQMNQPQQQQFMQRSQYVGMQATPNMPMQQHMRPSGNYNQQVSMQTMQPQQQQPQHMNQQQQWQQQAVPRQSVPQQQMPQTVLTRQLSGANTPQHNPYHHNQGY